MADCESRARIRQDENNSGFDREGTENDSADGNVTHLASCC